jgi:hypothetical protein
MLADASISRADVSKAKPRAGRPAIGHTHAGRRPKRGAGKQRRRWQRRGIPAPGGRHRGGEPGVAVEEEGLGSPPRRRAGRGHRRGGIRVGGRWGQ